jgi:hypothetical protein
MRIRQSVQDDIHEDVEAHVRRIPQCLYHNARQVVIRHDLVDRVGEKDARVAVRHLRDRSAQRIDGVMRQAPQDTFGLTVHLHGAHTQLGMLRVGRRLPFAVQFPAHRRFKLADHIPDLDRAHRVAADERESGEEIEAEDLVPELADRMIRVRHAYGFLRRRVDLELATSQGKRVREGTRAGRRTVDVICNLPNLANFVKNTGSRDT